MPAITKRIARRIAKFYAWYTQHNRDKEDQARRDNFSAFQQRRRRLSRLADLRFQDFCLALNNYRSQLQYLKGLDNAHETYAWDRLRLDAGPGLLHYLNEHRPGRNELEATLKAHYKEAVRCGDELEGILEDLRKQALEIPQANLPDKAAHALNVAIREEHKERWSAYSPWKQVLADSAGSETPADASTIAKWRTAQNLRRHTPQ